MLDISNKLHAMVDEFVSNLSSECDSLANNVSSQAQLYAAHDSAGPEAAKAPRLSNRTTTEVLNGLRRPSGSAAMGHHNKEGRPRMEHVKSNHQEGSKKIMDGGRSSRHTQDTETRSASLERLEKKIGSKSDHVSKGKFVHTVEVLSSDHSSDVSLRPTLKSSKEMRGRQSSKKRPISTPRGRTTRIDVRSPSTSPGSSESLDYSYEEDANSLGLRSPPPEKTFPKLRWPEDVEDIHEVAEKGEKGENNSAQPHNESHKNERSNRNEDTSLQLGDDSNEEDAGDNPGGSETDDEELIVLPKVPVKRKILNERRGSEKRTQRGTRKSASPPTKKQRTPQIDASVITQLEFGRRPENSVSMPTMLLPFLCMLELLQSFRIHQ